MEKRINGVSSCQRRVGALPEVLKHFADDRWVIEPEQFTLGCQLIGEAYGDLFRWALFERSGRFSGRKAGKSLAASVISSVIAPAKPENGRERTKADPRIRRRRFIGLTGVMLTTPVFVGVP